MKEKLFKNKTAVIILALIVSALWGTLYPMIKVGYQTSEIDTKNVASIILYAGLRFFISGILLVIVLAMQKKKLALQKKDAILPILIVSFFTVILQYVLTYTGLSMIESSKSSILKQSGFLLLPCVMFLFRKDEKFSVLKVLGASLGFVSVIVLNSKNMSFFLGVGEIMVIVSSISSAAGQVISKHYYEKMSPAEFVGWGQLFGGLVMVVIGVIFGGKIGRVDLISIGVLLYMCLASIGANMLWNTLIKYNDMSTLSVLKSADPLFASVFSGLLLSENVLNARFLIALVLIFCAIVLGNIKFKKRIKQHENENRPGRS